VLSVERIGALLETARAKLKYLQRKGGNETSASGSYVPHGSLELLSGNGARKLLQRLRARNERRVNAVLNRLGDGGGAGLRAQQDQRS